MRHPVCPVCLKYHQSFLAIFSQDHLVTCPFCYADILFKVKDDKVEAVLSTTKVSFPSFSYIITANYTEHRLTIEKQDLNYDTIETKIYNFANNQEMMVKYNNYKLLQ